MRALLLLTAVACTQYTDAPTAAGSAARAPGGFRLVTWNIETIGVAGSSERAAALAILARLDADVVALQEVEWPTDGAGLSAFAAEAGYPHVVSGWPVSYGDDTQAILSRLPVTASALLDGDDLSGDPLAHDLTRSIVTATVDVDGQPVTIATGHLKASDGDLDEFRRAVDAQRLFQALGAVDMATDRLIACGDLNDDLGDPANVPAQWTSAPAGLPAGYYVGADLWDTLHTQGLPNSAFTVFTDAGMHILDAVQRSGDDVTRPASGRRLDYVIASPRLAAGAVAEVYDTADEGLFGPLAFAGAAPAWGTLDAADHLPVVVDLVVADAAGDAGPAGDEDPAGDDGGPLPVAELEPGDLLITEVSPNPADPCADEVGEWVEISNRSGVDVDLAGLWLHDDKAGAAVIGARTLAPGEVAVLGRTLDACGVGADLVFSRPLSNGGDRVAIARPDGLELDALAYGATPVGVTFTKDGATTCEGLGTPGVDAGCAAEPPPAYTVADVPVGGLRVQEVLADPGACSDAAGEWVEVLNTSGGVVDLAGLRLGDAIADREVVFSAPVSLAPGGRALLGRTLALCGGAAAVGTFTASLNNTGDTVELLRADGGWIDGLDYGAVGRDVSVGRAADGAACEQLTPTPGADDAGCR